MQDIVAVDHHATSIGRSIAGNNKPLYDYLFAYNGDQMAGELNMQSKHSIEKQTAHNVDCFTTVSEITDTECKQLLEKPADVVLMNGFEDDFVPKGSTFTGKRKRARAAMLRVANSLLGTDLDDSTLILGTSGRYEFKNKGIDVFIESLQQLNNDETLTRNVLAFINVPAWRLNEKHYGQLQGLNKAETAAKYGDEQVLVWRRSYDVAPHPLAEDDERNPRFEARYREVPDAELPRTEALKDTIERIMLVT